MNKVFLVLLALLVPLGAVTGTLLWWRGESPSWTTRSPEALESFEVGLDAMMKEYRPEARDAFERALELDDEFWAAKLFLSHYSREVSLYDLLEVMTPERLASLTPREQLFFEIVEEYHQGESRSEIIQRVETYLKDYPDDPFIAIEKCDLAWADDDWEGAAECYSRLLEKHPNWVIAQERLGSIALAQGRFDEAEEQFRTYLYIAPDQANPYASLGRLLALRGRYEEAEETLKQGVAIKPDFCMLYQDLAWLRIFSGHFVEAEAALDDLMALKDCAEEGRRSVCTIRTLIDLLQEDLDGAQTWVDGSCLELNKGFYTAAHRLAVLQGRISDAERMEGYVQQWIDKHDRKKWEAQGLRATLAHAQGVRLLYTGQPEAAAEHFQKADELLPFWGTRISTLKLFNRLNLAYSLRAAGRGLEAEQAYTRIREVNPHFAAEGMKDLEEILASGAGQSEKGEREEEL